MRRFVRLAVGLAAGMMMWGCGGEQLIPNDIQKLMNDDGGQWVLKAVEAHGGIWRWRQRDYAKFDYAILKIRRGMDTTVTNRRRDTTIAPRVDTITNIRDLVTLDLKNGLAYAESKAQNPAIKSGFNGNTFWKAVDTLPVTDSVELAQLPAYFREINFAFRLPFTLLDTTFSFQVVGDVNTVDTLIKKGKEPGTFDTTTTPYSIKKLKVNFTPGAAPDGDYVFYLDGRDGRVRQVLTTTAEGSLLWVWSDLDSPVGLVVGGRRLAFPADAAGNVIGEYVVDMRFFNSEFPRKLNSDPFTWTPPAAQPALDTAATQGS